MNSIKPEVDDLSLSDAEYRLLIMVVESNGGLFLKEAAIRLGKHDQSMRRIAKGLSEKGRILKTLRCGNATWLATP